jgi:hypothetical protein
VRLTAISLRETIAEIWPLIGVLLLALLLMVLNPATVLWLPVSSAIASDASTRPAADRMDGRAADWEEPTRYGARSGSP